jgi:glutaredoxin 3
MKILSVIIVLLVAATLGLGTGYLYQNNPFAESRPARTGAVVKTGDFSAIQTRVDSKVVVYTLATCTYCKNAKKFLTEHGVRYAELPLDSSMHARDEAKSLGATRVPFILIGSNSIEGFNEAQMLAVLDKQQLL